MKIDVQRQGNSIAVFLDDCTKVLTKDEADRLHAYLGSMIQDIERFPEGGEEDAGDS